SDDGRHLGRSRRRRSLMSLEGAIDRFRRRQADQFSQTCNVDRPTGEPTFNPATNTVTQPVERIHTGLECKVSSNDRSGVDTPAGETVVRLVDCDIKFPVGTDVAMNDLVTIVTSKYHPLSVGKQYRITDVDDRE